MVITHEIELALMKSSFDKLHDQGRLKWTTQLVPFSFPVFCVYKNLIDDEAVKKRKGRVVMDIRAIDQIVIPNADQVSNELI